jgi:F-type H+-transporting ATPase subunit b
LIWQWVNFLILIGGLGYLIAKSAGSYFRSRTDLIRKGIAEAAKMKSEAEAQARAMEQRLAGLGKEVEALKAEAARELGAESDRIAQSTAASLDRIRENTAREIEALAKTARMELKSYAASLALSLAEQQLRDSIDDTANGRLADGFTISLTGRPSCGRSAR